VFPALSSPLFQYHYDAASNETERDNTFNGVKQVYPRDALNRMQYVDVINGASVTLAHEGYTYDPMNRITAVAYPTPQPADSFSYYQDGELNTATLGNLAHTLTYNLDKKGNRTSVVDNSVTSTYTPNAMDQYTTGASLSVVNGTEHEIQTYNGVSYTYLNDERLESAATGSTTYTMVYDALGRCMKRSLSNGPLTYYIYDGDKPILEYDSTGTWAGTNVYGKGVDEVVERSAINSNGQSCLYFPQQNHEGSVTLLTDISGSAIERYRYDAFGKPTVYNPVWVTLSATIYDNRFLFTGREYAATYRSTYTNSAFNFYEYRARAYNPQLGRFMSEDPKLFDAGDYNLFRYCHNDPIDFTDPMGLYVGLDDAILAGTGALIGLGGQGLEDAMSGHFSGWQAYTGAALGGAVGGWSSEYIGPVLGAAAGSATANAATQGLRIASGTQHGFSGRQLAAQTFFGAAASKVPGIPLGRLNQGRNNYSAIAKQIQTKLQNGTVSSVSSKTAAKAVAGRIAGESGSMAAEAAANAAAHASESSGTASTNATEQGTTHFEFRAGITFNADGTRTITFPDRTPSPTYASPDIPRPEPH
jgi:RHS repeat-associated protein